MGRSPCCEDNKLKKGSWTLEEDEKLVDYVQKHGQGNWKLLSKRAGLNRCGKSCRLRWTNYLRPDIKRGNFSDEEEKIIINLHSVLGNKWSKIATHLPGRTDNEIKNFWNTRLRKKLLQTGIDPVTHKPVADLNFFANLSQLLYATNVGNLMRPWDNIAVTELAKLQILQSVLQVMNTNPFPNIDQTSLVGRPLDLNLASSQFLNQITSQTCFEGGFNHEEVGFNNNTLSNTIFDIQTELTIPALASDHSTESSLVDKIENNPTYLPIDSPTSTSSIFEAWEKMMDDEANCFWNDII